jgi:hypothetical protein
MGKHYIPQFLLRGFTHEGRLHVFDKAKVQWFRSQPKSVANERDLWPDEVETFITEEVEGPARDAISGCVDGNHWPNRIGRCSHDT